MPPMLESPTESTGPRRPWVTMIVCGLSVLVWLASATDEPGTSMIELVLAVIAAGARSTSLVIDAHEGWRLLTCHFVHTSALHLGFNLAFLFPVGGAIEQVVPRRDYVALLLAAAVGSSLCSLLGTPQVSAGASGLVFAVLGAAVSVGLRQGPRLPPGVRTHFGGWVLPFLLIVLVVSSTNPGVDHWSHAGGLATGLLVGLTLPLAGDRGGSPARVLVAAAATVALVGTAPLIAARGKTTQRVALDDGSSVSVPSGWHARFGPAGELQFTSAGGLVVLAAERSPAGTWDERGAWYRSHRLSSQVTAGNVSELREGRLESIQTTTPGATVRFAYEKDGIAMVRDVFFLAPHTVLSLELPRQWAGKYDETRTAIVGSIRPAPSAGSPTAVTAALASGTPK